MARIMKRVVSLVAATSILSGIALYIYTLPGLRRLPKAKQRSLDGITTIDDAVHELQDSGKTGWALVAAAQTLVNAKMEYSRRNGWDTAPRAFRRGMGYCQQQAMALLLILRQLGIAAWPVQALRCTFPPARIHEYWDPGGISGHMWLVVSIDGVEKDVCPGHPDNAPGNVHFEVLSRKTTYGPVMRLFGHIGSMILNMHRDNAALRTMRSQKAETRFDAPEAIIPILNTIPSGPKEDSSMSGAISGTYISWRATQAERKMRVPGDGLVPSPLLETTHAVTINAAPQQVWPWLVQIGQGRAGFYADSRFWDRSVDRYYRLLSREQTGKAMVGYHVETSDRIVPVWQNPRVGDIIADGPPGTAYYVVRQVEPNKAFVLYTDTHLRYLLPARLRDNPRLGVFGELSAGYLLTEPEAGKTRLVRRMRMRCGPWPFRMLAVPIVLLWGEAITARHFLRGVKRRAEAPLRSTGSAQPLSFMERLKTGIEHELDTRSVGLAAGLIRLTRGRIARLWRRQVLLLTTRGRKSGRQRTVPLQFFPDGSDMIVVVANSGLLSLPGWYFNLTADPFARVEVGNRTLQVRAEELPADEAASFWPRVLQVAPDYARYPRRTSRRIPLIRLVPIGPGEGSSP